MDSEEKASYTFVIVFYQDVERLSDNYASLNNLLVTCRAVTGCKDFVELLSFDPWAKKKLPSNLHNELIQRVTDFRWASSRCYFKFNSLKTTFPSFQSMNRVDELYAIIESYAFPPPEVMREFTNKMFELFGDEIVRKALESAQNQYLKWSAGVKST